MKKCLKAPLSHTRLICLPLIRHTPQNGQWLH